MFLLDPKIEPKISNLDEQVETTGNSIKVQWDDASINCTKFNGFYSNYYIELKVSIKKAINKILSIPLLTLHF